VFKLQGGTMNFMKKGIRLFIFFISYISLVVCVTSVEIRLNKTYLKLVNNSAKQAKMFCGQLNDLCKQLLVLDTLNNKDSLIKNLSYIMRVGMLLELSEYGVASIKRAAETFVYSSNKQFPLSHDGARLLKTDAKRFIFSWVTNRLELYNEVSFFSALTGQHEFPESVSNLFGKSQEPHDFKLNVATKAKVLGKLREKGLAVR
jgi:hypothetical protein